MNTHNAPMWQFPSEKDHFLRLCKREGIIIYLERYMCVQKATGVLTYDLRLFYYIHSTAVKGHRDHSHSYEAKLLIGGFRGMQTARNCGSSRELAILFHKKSQVFSTERETHRT